MPSKPHLLKTLERASPDILPHFRMTERDTAILKAVYEYRALTTPQIETLLFPPNTPGVKVGKKTRCQLRLKLLYHHGYLWRDELPTKRSDGNTPLVYRIDTKALEELPNLLDCEPEDIDWTPQEKTLSDPFMAHLLKTNDVRVSLTAAAASQGMRVTTWLDDRTLKRTHAKEKVTVTGPQGGKQQLTLIPDGYFALWTGKKDLHHFIEVDLRNTVGEYSRWGGKDWATKIRGYIAYYESGQYERRYTTTSLRVLTVTTTERRLATLKRITEGAGGKVRFWFTTFDRLTSKTALTDPIWQVASKEGLHTLLI